MARLRGDADRDRAAELAERFRADLDRPLGELSRGNRQKIGLILAAFHRPDLLVLDEPTGGLDPMMQEEFLALVGEERERGATVFLSSHELDEVERICDRVGIVREGRLIAVERVPDLLGRARRKVTVRLADPGGFDDLRRLPGVVDAKAADGELTFRFAGDLDPSCRRSRPTTSSTSRSRGRPSRRSSSATTKAHRRTGARVIAQLPRPDRLPSPRAPPLAARLGAAAGRDGRPSSSPSIPRSQGALTEGRSPNTRKG